MANIGIYKITNKLNNKIYIGQSLNIFKRWAVHGNINKANNKKQVISKAIEKYGVENFIFEILEVCSKEELNAREIFWVNYYDSYNRGYNCTEGGGCAGSLYTKLDKDTIPLLYAQLADNKIQISELAKMYGVVEGTIRAVNTGDTWHTPLLNYPLRRGNTVYHSSLTKKSKHCKTCGVKISNKASSCLTCLRKVENRPTKGVLFFKLSNTSFSKVGKVYGVSDNTIRKWCKRYKLPHTVKGLNSIRWSARRDSNSHMTLCPTVAG